MSKLCQCKRTFIRGEIMKYGPAGTVEESTELTSLIENIIETDCVCEKKEENENESNYTTSPQSCRVCGTTEVTTLVHGACLSCIGVLVRESVMKEKQSQYPCEHEFKKRRISCDNGERGVLEESFLLTLWCYYKCGLVTCKNPNNTKL
jgi:hypothetical protein